MYTLFLVGSSKKERERDAGEYEKKNDIMWQVVMGDEWLIWGEMLKTN